MLRDLAARHWAGSVTKGGQLWKPQYSVYRLAVMGLESGNYR